MNYKRKMIRQRRFLTVFAILAIFAGFSFADAPKVPDAFISIGKTRNILIAEKSSHTLYIYEGSRVIKTYPVTTGKNKGDKQKKGDHKTPEGIYFFIDVIGDKELPAEYGVLAITTDYPNPIDRLKQKGGGGIWLHATDDEKRILKPFDTRGCVVATNKDVLEIAKYIELLKTPLIIVDKISYQSSGAREDKRVLKKEILEVLKEKGNTLSEDAAIFAHKNTIVVSDGEIVYYLVKNAKVSGTPGKGWKIAGEKRLDGKKVAVKENKHKERLR